MTYNLSVPKLNPAAPEWLRLMLSQMQFTADHKYTQQLESYFAGAQQWIDANVISRDQSPDPTVFLPAPFTHTPPAREVFDGNPDGTYFAIQVVDPNIVPPVLPKYIPPPAPGVIKTEAPNAEASINAALATIIRLLLEIKAGK